MTPLEKARTILCDIQDYGISAGVPLPEPASARMGAPVLACESTVIGVLNSDVDEVYGPTQCNAAQLTTFAVVVGLDCSNMADQSGADIPEQVDEVSDRMDAVGQMLWEWAVQWPPFLSKQWFISYAVTGGLAVVTMQLITDVD